MVQIGMRLQNLFSAGVLLGCIASVAAAPATDSDEDAQLVRQLHKYLARSFVLSKELPLDPAMRVEANKVAAAHLARISELLPVWVEEERRLQRTPKETASSTEVFFAVWARLLNELALWHLEPGDAEYEKATLAALKASPLVCEIEGDHRYSDFSSRIRRLIAMPAAQQETALATERQLLERWGKPRPAPQAWPKPLPQDAGMLVIAGMLAGGPRPPHALPPHLASTLLSKRETYNDSPWEAKCAFQQWWLRVSLTQGSTPEAALNAFRYGTLITATDRFGRGFEEEDETQPAPSQATPTYPKLAARFDVTGETIVTRRFDAPDKIARASVTDRKIKVRGIRGTRPVVFENTFDVIAVHFALKNGDAAKPDKPGPEAFKLVWNLAPHEAKTDKPSQGEQP